MDISHAKFQVDISIFGKHSAKPYPLMASFFKSQIWAFLDHALNKNDIFEILRSNLPKNTHFYSKIPIRKFDLYDPRLT